MLDQVRRRDATATISGAITGHLRPVGRTAPPRADQARQVSEHLTPAGPAPLGGGPVHSLMGDRDALDITVVRLELVREVTADRAIDHGGIFRHPVRFKRLRLDVTAADVPPFGQGPGAAAG